MNKSIHLFIVDDNRLLREGLVSMLDDQEDLVVIGTASSGDEALEQIKDLRPEVALIDIGMPDKDGIEVTQVLYQDAPEVKVIILGMIDLTDEIIQCIEAGAAGYVLKEASFDYLVETIRSVHRGESFCSPQMTASLFTRIAELAIERMPKIPTSSVKLTNRELEIINLIAEGLPNKEIAQRLFIETQTVKNHVHNILDKLQLHNRLEAVQYAHERNLLKKK
ncbi:response regulator transcription factor [candidate division KSB1 bacterium]|nr:response regulator transcription factor [candidate division KSB1 bacterium]